MILQSRKTVTSFRKSNKGQQEHPLKILEAGISTSQDNSIPPSKAVLRYFHNISFQFISIFPLKLVATRESQSG